MRKQTKYICLCLLAVGLYSCEQDDDGVVINPDASAANIVLLDNNISALDENEDLRIKLLSDGVEFESVEIQGSEGNVLTDATVSDSTATFNASALGDIESGDAIDLWIVSTLSNGEMLRQPVTVNVFDAITLDENPGSIRYLDTTATSLSYITNVSENFANFEIYTPTLPPNIDNVNLLRKTSADADYVDTGETFNVEGDTINLGEINYEELGVGVGDTIFYRFEAESGELNQAVEAQVVIRTQDFGGSTATTLANDPSMAAYNLGEGAYVTETDSIPAEIMFIEPLGFETMEDLDLVQADVPEDMTAAEYTAGLDLFKAEMTFEEGDEISSVDQVEAGDVYIYSTMRDGMTYYGYIMIGDVTITTVNDEETTSFNFEYAEGTIIRE